MANFRGSCLNCGEATIGPIMTAGLNRFHPECFRCKRCQVCIGDDEQYILVGLSTLFCGTCWTQDPNPQKIERPHVIKVINIPPTIKDPSQYKLKKNWTDSLEYDIIIPQVAEIGRFSTECQLSIGDRILEVNGTPVHDLPLQEIEGILNTRIAPVQVTVEQSPPIKDMPVRTFEETKVFGSLSSLELHCSESWGSYGDLDQCRDKLTKRRDEPRSRQARRLRGAEVRAASLSRLSDSNPSPPGFTKAGLARTLSFREQARSQCTFRSCDLVKGELLGKGFFGQVYKVTHNETNEVMVLKELYRLDEEAQKNFLKEVAVLRRLEHPNVLRFIGVLYKERKLHLITEFVRGGSLRDLIQNIHQDLTWTRRSRFAHDITCGMAYLHSMGVIHRDLSSHNCLVREDMSVVVADFGLARITSEICIGDRSRASKRGRRIERKKRYTVVGNPFWMAPEMMKGYKYDEKVDIFSFGIILCELIGRVHADPDFLPRSGDFSLNQQCFLEKFCKTCPESLYRIAFKCCDLNPDKRPAFEILSCWLESISSTLGRSLPVPKDLLDEIRSFGGLRSSVDYGEPHDLHSVPCSVINCLSSTHNNSGALSAMVPPTVSPSFSDLSSCSSSLSAFSKPGRLTSIFEIDHSRPEMEEGILTSGSNRTLSVSPS